MFLVSFFEFSFSIPVCTKSFASAFFTILYLTARIQKWSIIIKWPNNYVHIHERKEYLKDNVFLSCFPMEIDSLVSFVCSQLSSWISLIDFFVYYGKHFFLEVSHSKYWRERRFFDLCMYTWWQDWDTTGQMFAWSVYYKP